MPSKNSTCLYKQVKSQVTIVDWKLKKQYKLPKSQFDFKEFNELNRKIQF